MKMRIFGIWALSMVVGQMAFADNSSQGAYDYTAAAAKVYQSQDANAFGMPSGAINVKVTTPASDFTAAGTPTEDTTKYYQGCSGVTLGDYTTGLFFDPNTFNNFKRDVNSDLAKNLLTYNYSMPQTAALFDTLNAYGVSRYQQFKSGCQISPLKQDARNAYLNKCMATQIKDIDTRISTLRTSLQSANLTPTPDDKQIAQWAYAQAWESCTASPTTVDDVTNKLAVNLDFGKALVNSQNVNKIIKPLLCTKADGTALTSGCWQTLFLPKVSLCIDSTLDPDAGNKGCSDGGKYGVKAAPVGMTAFFDLVRYVVSEGMVKKVYNDFMTQFKTGKGDADVLMSAADESAASMDQLTIVGSTNTDATKAAAPTPVDDSVATFEQSFLNCNNHNGVVGLDVMAEVLKKRTPAITITPKTMIQGKKSESGSDLTDYDIYINAMGLANIDDAENAKKALKFVTQTATGCTINQHVPMFDPHLVAQMNKYCNVPLDVPAFQTMAGYDVALQGTRDVYQFLLFQLKQVHGRLLTDSMVPRASTSDPSATSPEINKRLADAVQEIMIPYVEAQIARLDKINQTRGQFSHIVSKIYATKQGCVGAYGGGFATGGGFGGGGFSTGGGF